MIKIFLSILFTFNVLLLFAQPANDNCSNATVLCYNQTITGNNIGATVENCFDCADDYPNTIGFTSSSSVWYEFTTNSIGGDVTITFSNLIFNTDPNLGQALQAIIWTVPNPCQGQSYSPASASETNGTGNFSITAFGLAPNTTYYVLVNGDNTGTGVSQPAEVTFDILLTGPGVIVSPPVATISASNTIICQGDIVPVDFSVTNCSDTLALNWYYNNQFIQDSSTVNTAIFSQDGYLKLIIECGNICVYTDTTDSIFFNVTPIEVDAGNDTIIELGSSVVLNGSGTANPVWTPETGLSSTTTFTPTATPEVTTTYFLTVTNNGCVKTDEVTVKIKEIIIIPSAFTPNNDGVNDIWEIKNINQYPNNIVKIYDRSGQLVFKTTGYKNIENRWDGTYKAKLLPSSTYYYVIDLRNGDKEAVFKGFVTIIK
ncbi:MAG TPA: gliding motility-associated C-terminal domain-containing protein [Crocinitomix sp.]|nr:gliding motility-associated C-terminal domain-containing protein [Crocinitomix sp.]